MLFFSKYLDTRQNAEICIDNIFTVFGGVVLEKSLSIPMDTRCDPTLDDLFIYKIVGGLQGLANS